ncbi:hypothetical protein SAMN05421830_11027 [Desulfomicrobium norvegicum]|uniref:Uncharacterized protein n=2 Tax=Desulfomicrobium norvegicum (strain DSM 1741 / NCIMB 8310) TaxID=52561 RepID=A0A8G2F8P6_DESNO|nr:hypothetical protein SAMN05421830_11027 [Desulfomicrobium norvegicum]
MVCPARLDERIGSGQSELMWRSTLSELFRYLRVAPFPHLTTLKVSALAALSGCEAWLFLEQPEFSWAAWVWIGLTGLFAWGVVLCQADAFSRYREFKRLRRLLRRYGFRPGLFRLVAASRCQRDAALLAARETGCRAQARHVFRELGYRWYHVLPDAIVANPFIFFHPRFLRSTFVPGKRTKGLPCG